MNCPDCGTTMEPIPFEACPGFKNQSEVPSDWMYCPECEDATDREYNAQLEGCFDALDYVNKYFSLVFADAITYLCGEIEMDRETRVTESLPANMEYWTIDPYGGDS